MRTADLEWHLPPEPMTPKNWHAWRVRDALPVGTRVMVDHSPCLTDAVTFKGAHGAGTVTSHRKDMEGWLVPVIDLDTGDSYSSVGWAEYPGRVRLLLDEPGTQQHLI